MTLSTIPVHETNTCPTMPSHIKRASEESFHWSRQPKPMVTTIPPLSLLINYCSKSLVISQQVAMSTVFLAGHRCMVCHFSFFNTTAENCQPCHSQDVLWNGIGWLSVVVCMICTVLIWKRLSSSNPIKEKISTRAYDAVIIGTVLQLISSLLRVLTASYSSNTVMPLAIGGMIVHLLTCDYHYANGGGSTVRSNNSNLKRPVFHGGTISIKSAFFSATLLASKFSSGSSLVSYTWFIITIIMFAFYPMARNSIQQQSPSFESFLCTVVITVVMIYVSYTILNPMEQLYLTLVLTSISILSPILKWWLYQYKQHNDNNPATNTTIIAHVTVKEQ